MDHRGWATKGRGRAARHRPVPARGSERLGPTSVPPLKRAVRRLGRRRSTPTRPPRPWRTAHGRGSVTGWRRSSAGAGRVGSAARSAQRGNPGSVPGTCRAGRASRPAADRHRAPGRPDRGRPLAQGPLGGPAHLPGPFREQTAAQRFCASPSGNRGERSARRTASVAGRCAPESSPAPDAPDRPWALPGCWPDTSSGLPRRAPPGGGGRSEDRGRAGPGVPRAGG